MNRKRVSKGTAPVLKRNFRLAGLIALAGFCAIVTVGIPFVGASDSNQPIIVDVNERADRKDGTSWSPKQVTGELWAAYATYDMSYIEVTLRKDGAPGDVNLIIQEAPGGIPSGTNLTLLTIPAKNVPAWKSWIRFDVSGVSIAQGKQYWFGIYATSGKAKTDQYALGMSDGSYTDGIVLNRTDGVWQPSESYDCLFRTFGTKVSKTTDRIIPPSSAPFKNGQQAATNTPTPAPSKECSLPKESILFIFGCLGVIGIFREFVRK